MGGERHDDVQELWNFDELDELEAQQSSSEDEAKPAVVLPAEGSGKEDLDEEVSEAGGNACAAEAAAESAAGARPAAEGQQLQEEKGPAALGKEWRGKLDYLFGPSDSEESDSEEDEDEDVEEEIDEISNQIRDAPSKKKKKYVFEDPMTKLTNLEDPRLRGEQLPLQERVRGRLTRLAEERLKGKPPGPPGPPPPPPKEDAQKRKAGKKAPDLFGEQPLLAREQDPRRHRPGRMHDNVEMREKGSSPGEVVSNEFHGVKCEGLPGAPAPVLRKRFTQGVGRSMPSGARRRSILALAVAEAREATAREVAKQTEELSCCASCGCSLEQPMHCAKCLAVCYCSRECQRRDWKVHKLSCGKNGSAATSTTPSSPAHSLARGNVSPGPAEDGAPTSLLEEESRQRQLEERQRLEDQRRLKLEEQRRKAEEARKQEARDSRQRTAELRQQRLEEARRKAEKQKQEKAMQKAKEDESVRKAQEEAFRLAEEAEERERRKIEAAAYEEFLLAQVQQQEILEMGGAPQPQRSQAAAAPLVQVAPVQAPPFRRETLLQPAQVLPSKTNAFNMYKQHQPGIGQRLAALGML